MNHSQGEIADALVTVIGDSRWEAVAYAHGWRALAGGASPEQAAREIYDRGAPTLRRSREAVSVLQSEGLTALLAKREKTGSAENAITKLFPATITEQRFLEELEGVLAHRKGLSYTDDRHVRHGLTDFTLKEGTDLQLPINIKNAGTRFERAQDLVGLDPDDCVPIPAYKAHNAVEAAPSLLYVVSVDYELLGRLAESLPKLLNRHEAIVWELLNAFGGSRLQQAEDAFVFSTVRRYWDQLRGFCGNGPFRAISARRALRVLHTQPKRTPGIGLRAWGTGASAEVNVHVSIATDMTPWGDVVDRIISMGISDVIRAVNRKRIEEVYDPEI